MRRAAAAVTKIQSFLPKSNSLPYPISQTQPFSTSLTPVPSLDTELSVSETVHHILTTTSPVEPQLDLLRPIISSNLVTTVLTSTPSLPLPLAFRFFNWATLRARFRSLSSFQIIVSILKKSPNGFQSAWESLTAIKENGLPVSPHVFEAMISGYGEMGMTGKAVEVFGRMKDDFGVCPNVFVYNSILAVLVKDSIFVLAMAVYNMLLKSSCSPNRTTFKVLINGHCKQGEVKDALNLFDEMSRRGLVPDGMVYNCAIQSLCRAKRMEDAVELLDSMQRNNIDPCVVTYKILINGYCKLGRIKEAYMVLEELKERGFELGLDGYSCLIDGLLTCKEFDEACRWYRVVLDHGLQPDCVLYTTMIKGYVGEGMVEEAFTFLCEMTDKGVQPDTMCYNTLIKGLCDIGQLNAARTLQLEISANDCFPNSATYTIIVCGLCREGLLMEADQIFEEMGRRGCFPTVRTFNALISGLCNFGKIQEAQIMFCKMEMGRNPSVFLRLSQASDLLSDDHCLKELVGRLSQSGHVTKAYNLLRLFTDSGVVRPNNYTYAILVNSYCKNKEYDRVFNLVRDLQVRGLSLDTVTYCTIINRFLRNDRLEDAVAIYDRMLKSGCTPSLMVYRTIMKVFCRMRNVARAVNIWLNHLSEKTGLSSDHVASIDAAKKHLDQGSIEGMVRCLIKMDLENGGLSCPKPYCIWIIGYCRAGKPDLGYQIFNVMKDSDIDASPASCASLIHVFCKQNKTAPATEIMDHTLRKGYELAERYGNFLLQTLYKGGKKEAAFDLASRIQGAGYDLNMYLNNRTKALFCKLNDSSCSS